MRVLTRATELAREGLIEWAPAEDAPPLKGGAAYAGRAVVDGGTWRFLVLSFGIEDQGFPAGTLGHDGTLAFGTTIVRLPRDLAHTLHAAAAASTKAVE